MRGPAGLPAISTVHGRPQERWSAIRPANGTKTSSPTTTTARAAAASGCKYRCTDTGAVLATQALLHAQVHNIARSDTRYAGLLGWAGFDYASLNGDDRIWKTLKTPGVLDTFRVPKPGAAFYRSQVDPRARPVVLPVFFWDFGPTSPPSGPGPDAMIATNCERLEIYLGGRHFATGKIGRAHV